MRGRNSSSEYRRVKQCEERNEGEASSEARIGRSDARSVAKGEAKSEARIGRERGEARRAKPAGESSRSNERGHGAATSGAKSEASSEARSDE